MEHYYIPDIMLIALYIYISSSLTASWKCLLGPPAATKLEGWGGHQSPLTQCRGEGEEQHCPGSLVATK